MINTGLTSHSGKPVSRSSTKELTRDASLDSGVCSARPAATTQTPRVDTGRSGSAIRITTMSDCSGGPSHTRSTKTRPRATTTSLPVMTTQTEATKKIRCSGSKHTSTKRRRPNTTSKSRVSSNSSGIG